MSIIVTKLTLKNWDMKVQTQFPTGIAYAVSFAVHDLASDLTKFYRQYLIAMGLPVRKLAILFVNKYGDIYT